VHTVREDGSGLFDFDDLHHRACLLRGPLDHADRRAALAASRAENFGFFRTISGRFEADLSV
jgi:hypothetical protein